MRWDPFQEAIPVIHNTDIELDLPENQKLFKNNHYQVHVIYHSNGLRHLSIKRLDKAPVHDWRHFQWIKNELCGPEWAAVELYPPESCLVDTANQYHLFAFEDHSAIPFMFRTRLVCDGPFRGWGTAAEL